MSRTRLKRTLPGDNQTKIKSVQTAKTNKNVAAMIRVNHAGEYGAQQIYKGQIAVLGKTEIGDVLRHMAEQEDVHLRYFEKELVARRVRPTLFQPLWHVAGYMLGAGTALMGKEAAMACTEAVETVIVEHYQDQLERLGDDEKTLKKTIKKFQDEEEEHKQIGIEHDAHNARPYKLLTEAIKVGSKIAIKISEKI